MILIRIFQEGEEPVTHKITQFPCSIGRSHECAIVVAADSVSAHHAEVRKTETGYRLVDLGSTNQIFFGGAQLSELPLNHLTRFQLGTLEFEFLVDSGVLEKTKRIEIPRPVESSGGWKSLAGRDDVAVALLFPLLGATEYSKVLLESGHERIQMFWMQLLGAYAGMLAAAMVFSLLVKIVTKKFSYFRVLKYFLFVSILMQAQSPLFRLIDGNWSESALVRFAAAIPSLALGWLFIFLICTVLVSTAARNKLALLAAVILATLVSVAQAESRWVHVTKYEGSIAYPIRHLDPINDSPAVLTADIEQSVGEASRQAIEQLSKSK